jgi:hypothetical protein
MGLATVWAIFSLKHLVAVAVSGALATKKYKFMFRKTEI